MRLLLLLLPPLLFVGATCLSAPRSKGPDGPWVGDVTNYGPDIVSYNYVGSSVIDAHGDTIGYLQAATCPFTLLPGDVGSYELTAPPGFAGSPSLPLALGGNLGVQNSSIAEEQLPYTIGRDADLVASIVKVDPVERVAIVAIENKSPFSFQQLQLCVKARGVGGDVASVGYGMVTRSQLSPGESITVPVLFNTLPTGSMEAIAEGFRSEGCCHHAIDASALHVTKTALVQRADGLHFEVVGEFTNPTHQDLAGVTVSAHLDDMWRDRTDGASVGCNGQVARDAAVPLTLSIPVGSTNPKRALKIETFDGFESTFAELASSSVTLGAVRTQTAGPDVRTASFVVKNESAYWMGSPVVCVALRDVNGNIVGATSGSPAEQYIAPGESIQVEIDVEQLAGSRSAESIVYGQPLLTPPPTPVAGPIP